MDTKITWEAVLSEIELSVSRGAYLTFFSNTTIGSIENEMVTILCPNPYVSSMIEDRYYGLIQKTLEKHLKKERVGLLFKIGQSGPKKEEEKESGPLFAKQNDKLPTKIFTNLRGDFTFETFAVSGSNQLAYAAATAIVKSPGKAYNPLFLWGGVGVGKTHLMHAVGHELLKKNQLLKIVYCAGEDFTNEIVEAIRQKRTAFFKEKYRSANVLLIDDVQFIAGKNTVQEEFFHTFNAIYGAGGQIILTSDRPPSEISKLEDRLRSRFEGGMTVDISPPDFELRTAILLIKSKARGKELPIEVAKTIASKVVDTRKLEGTLVKLLATAEMDKVAVSSDLATKVIGGIKPAKRGTSWEEAMSAVCGFYNLKASQIKGEKRDKSVVVPRQILMYLLRAEMGMSLVGVGKILGGRDHTTIIHGVEKIRKELSVSERIRDEVEEVKRLIWG